MTPPHSGPLFPPVAPPAPHKHRISPGLRVTAFLVAVAIVGVTAVALYTIQSIRETTEHISNAFQPQSNFKTVLTGAIGKLNNQPKLVVLTADVTGTVIQENSTTVAGLNVGSAKVEISAPAKVQYYVPMDHIKVEDFYYDAAAKRLVLSIDKPLLDTDVVSIDTSPDKLMVKTEYGYRPFSVFKGPAALEEARRHLKEATLEQGRHELLFDRAQKNAKESIANQMGTLFEALGDGVKFEVEFKK